MAASYEFGLALTSTGDVYSFGLDDSASSGPVNRQNRTNNPHPTPAKVTFPPGAGPVTQIAVGELTAYALTASGRLFGWGEGFAHDQLGFEEPPNRCGRRAKSCCRARAHRSFASAPAKRAPTH